MIGSIARFMICYLSTVATMWFATWWVYGSDGISRDPYAGELLAMVLVILSLASLCAMLFAEYVVSSLAPLATPIAVGTRGAIVFIAMVGSLFVVFGSAGFIWFVAFLGLISLLASLLLQFVPRFRTSENA